MVVGLVAIPIIEFVPKRLELVVSPLLATAGPLCPRSRLRPCTGVVVIIQSLLAHHTITLQRANHLLPQSVKETQYYFSIREQSPIGVSCPLIPCNHVVFRQNVLFFLPPRRCPQSVCLGPTV